MQIPFNCEAITPIIFQPTRGAMYVTPVYENGAGEKVFDVEIHFEQPLDQLTTDSIHGKAGDFTGLRTQRRLKTYPASMLKDMLKPDAESMKMVPDWDKVSPLFEAEGFRIILDK